MKISLLSVCLICLLFTSCKRREIHRDTSHGACNNLQLHVRELKRNDVVVLLYDTRVILQHTMDTAEGDEIKLTFCNKFRESGTLRFNICTDQGSIMDTSIIVTKPKQDYLIQVNRLRANLKLLSDTPMN
jgi:hypothetical protein